MVALDFVTEPLFWVLSYMWVGGQLCWYK